VSTDREVLRELYELYASRVYQRCRYLLKDEEEARDAMHDVFLKVHDKLDTFRGQSSQLTWLTRIATNHCLNLMRSRRAKWRGEIKELAKVAEQTRDSDQAALERHDLIHAVLARCDKNVQELAVYYFVDEMTQEEIAALAGISVPTLRKRLRSFMRVARRELKKVFPDAELKESLI